MKIIAILDSDITAGGGYNQSVNAVMQMQRLCEGRYCVEVFTTNVSSVPYLSSLGLTAHVFRYSVLDRVLAKLSSSEWWQIVQSRLRLLGPLEKKLKRQRCDLVYFVSPVPASVCLQELNYITTIWDLCHRDAPEFPEVRSFGEFQNRERQYIRSLSSALIVVTDSREVARRAADCYGIDDTRFLPMVFAPSPFLSHSERLGKETVLSRHRLREGYFLYPAQLWAHKNHIRILEALLKLRDRGSEPTVVFTGKDCGNYKHLWQFVSANGLVDQVKFLGFVPANEMRGLYEGAMAIVMPTYFGPTNLPPLEAWSLEIPLIYSANFREQAGDAALLIDPDNAGELAAAMTACSDPGVRMRLAESGKRQLRSLADQRTGAEADLLRRLVQFEARRRCWR